jgi:hypothetical protein
MGGGMYGGYRGAKAGIGDYEKEASVAQYAALADSLESGELGDDAKYAFEGVMDSVGEHITDDSLVKSASYPENHYNIYDENAARIARLETLLRK